jgi:hypothetical protein
MFRPQCSSCNINHKRMHYLRFIFRILDKRYSIEIEYWRYNISFPHPFLVLISLSSYALLVVSSGKFPSIVPQSFAFPIVNTCPLRHKLFYFNIFSIADDLREITKYLLMQHSLPPSPSRSTVSFSTCFFIYSPYLKQEVTFNMHRRHVTKAVFTHPHARTHTQCFGTKRNS